MTVPKVRLASDRGLAYRSISLNQVNPRECHDA